jgi:hypothetical protein
MKRLLALFLLLVCPLMLFGRKRAEGAQWQDGILKRTSNDRLERSSGHTGIKGKKRVFITYYFIEAGDSLYEAEDVETKDKKLDLPSAGEAHVSFLVSNSDFFLKDAKGKEHKLHLLNKVPVASAQAATPK